MNFEGSVVLRDPTGKELSARLPCAFSVEIDDIKGKLIARALVTPRESLVLTALVAGFEPRVSYSNGDGEEVLWQRVGAAIQAGEMVTIRPKKIVP